MTPVETVLGRLRTKRAEWLAAVAREDRELENAAMSHMNHDLAQLHGLLHGTPMIAQPVAAFPPQDQQPPQV